MKYNVTIGVERIGVVQVVAKNKPEAKKVAKRLLYKGAVNTDWILGKAHFIAELNKEERPFAKFNNSAKKRLQGKKKK